jgi:hypothetical protein
MSESKKRTKTTPKRKSSNTLTIREYTEKKGGAEYRSWLVQGWKEGGRNMRKKFKTKDAAKGFIAKKQIENLNAVNAMNTVLTPLNQDEVVEAASAFKALGGSYSLTQAVEYFLENHRPPEFTISIEDGLKLYIDDKERDGVRDRTIQGIRGIIRAFAVAIDNPMVHKVTPQAVAGYLRSLRAKDGISPAKRKTWNNHRNEFSQFFTWTKDADLTTNRPWRFNNPVEKIKAFKAERVAEQRAETATTSPEKLVRLFDHLMTFNEGSLVKMFALAYFAGIRPDANGEMGKLSQREEELINLKTGIISIPADVAKTKRKRSISISDNLMAWLEAYEGKPIIPVNFSNNYTKARKPFDLQQDEARHSFISYHIALHRSIGDTAMQAGNSEKMVHDHYLNLYTKDDGAEFFAIKPDMEKMTVAASQPAQPQTTLKAS